MRNLTKELVISIAKQFKTKKEFSDNDESAYKKAIETGWINEIVWMNNNIRYTSNKYCIYAYIDEHNKRCYIGLTKNIRERHNNHISNKRKHLSSVYLYFKSINKEIPKPIILKENLCAMEAQKYELEYYNYYIKEGYIMLNKAKMGVNIGSLSSTYIWEKESVFQESKKYTNRTDFKKYSNGAYNVARENKWNGDMPWLLLKKKESGYWDVKENVIAEAKKYRTRQEFMKHSSGAYHACLRNGWLNEVIERATNRYTKEDIFEIAKQYTTKKEFTKDYGYLYKVCKENGYFDEMYWLLDLHKQWKTKEDVFIAARECKNRLEFQKKYKGAYDKARFNNWLNEMTWFETKRHKWTFEELLEVSRKFNSNKEFNKGCHSAYAFAYKKGYIKKIREINGWHNK